jgi:hypothetical protein
LSQGIVVKSFEELASLFPTEDLPPDLPEVEADDSSRHRFHNDGNDLANLFTELEAAGVALARVIVRDQEARTLALRDLERYDALIRQQRDAESARERASQIRREAEAFVARAFGEEARAEATRVVEVARTAEEVAYREANAWREAAEQLAAQLDLERLLADRERQLEMEKAKAAATEQARRLSEVLARAKSALEAGLLAEARELLASLRGEDSDNPEIASLYEIIARRALGVKVAAAENAIQAARRDYRRDPLGVATRLAQLDVDGLPVDQRRQVFGEWARACSRLCRARDLVAPLRYAPDPGRGAILARESADSAYIVVSSLGMGSAWQQGEVVDERQVRRAQPLR